MRTLLQLLLRFRRVPLPHFPEPLARALVVPQVLATPLLIRLEAIRTTTAPCLTPFQVAP